MASLPSSSVAAVEENRRECDCLWLNRRLTSVLRFVERAIGTNARLQDETYVYPFRNAGKQRTVIKVYT